ncbi:hypothetical protein M758_8G004000 [Ceratodon purpureus]|nr:hypothetical protein M758_8G004000 [Ceratodon purpureus]
MVYSAGTLSDYLRPESVCSSAMTSCVPTQPSFARLGNFAISVRFTYNWVPSPTTMTMMVPILLRQTPSPMVPGVGCSRGYNHSVVLCSYASSRRTGRMPCLQWHLRSCFVRCSHDHLMTTTTTTTMIPTHNSPANCRTRHRRCSVVIARCSPSSQPLPHLVSRRACLLVLLASVSLPAAASTSVTTSLPQPSFLRSLGLSDADIYYPSFFEGTWNCFSTLTAVEAPQGEDKADRRSMEFSRKQLGYTVEYQARFVSFQGHVIGDRSFTTSSLVESTMGKDVIRAASWDPHQPNRLALTLRGGLKVENVVTKRSAEVTGPGQFDTSEFSKQVFDNSAMKDGPPSVKASQNLTRYRWDPTELAVDEIEAFQRVAMFPLPSEGMDLADVMVMDKPVTLYKYRVKFTRAFNP